MKHFVTLLIAAVLVGFVVFAIAYWVLNLEKSQSLLYAATFSIVGVAADYFKPKFKQVKDRKR